MKELIQNCRRKKEDLCILLIDIKNAFGSVPHSAIFEALKAAGTGNSFTDLIMNMYDKNLTQLLTSEGLSDPIEIKLDIKQGCPLSEPIFNLSINPSFALIQFSRADFYILGYANDIAIIEDSP